MENEHSETFMTKERVIANGWKVKYLDSAYASGHRHIIFNYNNGTALMGKIKELGYTKDDVGKNIVIELITGSHYHYSYEIYAIIR